MPNSVTCVALRPRLMPIPQPALLNDFGSSVLQFFSSRLSADLDVCQMAKLHIWMSFGSLVRQFRSSEVPEGRDVCQMEDWRCGLILSHLCTNFGDLRVLKVAVCAKWPKRTVGWVLADLCGKLAH